MLIITINKRARYNYEIIETYEAGLALTGSEIKSIRNNDVSINEAFVIIRKKEAFIINMVIAQYKFSTAYVPDADRTRKLLLHKSEIKKILQRIKLERLTMVPLKLYLKNNYAKLEIALVRGKKNYDKRELIKQRDNERLRQKR
ncbi:MAG: SsrA-binding protein SmpB [Spiroplasma poulsonii]|uniref:SsrA-binding protein n=2 Tax=Spiroplasmataceae TaxID=2131 RepID=A0A2P6FFR4_9MOLU|nr:MULTISPECIES: SsrA-binding protein SmpB [Spiroplasma]KAF0850114.1 SsrA-binding protein [Spiroplasma poulsonii]MBH8622465.1 SsrA-binding protein SmpB [Spiroplasma sp. hyd1]MBW1242029.1 SsrA-binding protein SmpB [Spiroplasma poulsonii]PQM32291.1 SsrA-binding protein [Spiroplasma poulsonii]PWF94945.1 SsrA-binding protein [Spiroplasma poulsonii]